MNEAEWMTCADIRSMLVFLEPRGNDRKLQLFATACCRRALSIGADPRHLALLDAAERFAEGLLSIEEFDGFRDAVRELAAGYLEDVPSNPSHFLSLATLHAKGGGSAEYAARFAARGLAGLVDDNESEACLSAFWAETSVQADLLRCVFGDPFRPFQFDPAWLADAGRHAQSMARTMEEVGFYQDLSLLADVLERAGCDDHAVLDHCRSSGPHVLGCWVLDALMGRESAVRGGLLTEGDWRACQDPTSLLHFLRDKGTVRTWRRFASACCRRIEPWITDERSRRALETAARHAEGTATDEALEEARSEAQAAREEAKHEEWVAEAEEDFRVTPRYAAICRRLFAAQAVRGAVCRDPRATDAQPGTFDAEYWRPSHEWADAAVRDDVYAWMGDDDDVNDPERDGPLYVSRSVTERRKLIHGMPGPRIVEASDRAGRLEMRAQGEILHDLFGEFLGPPGDEGAWLHRGGAGRSGPFPEWWCLLPTRRSVVVRPEWMEWSDGAVTKLAKEIHDEDGFDRLHLLVDALEKAGCDDSTILEHLRGGGPHVRGCWVLEKLTGRELPGSA